MSECMEKVTLKYPPCKQPEQSCIEYDYDPCETSGDITETDLEILLKGNPRLQQETKAKETERLRGQRRTGTEENRESQQRTEKNTEKEENTDEKKERTEKEEKMEKNREKQKEAEENIEKQERELEGKKDQTESGKPVKKCKKVIKNPFFNNRLEFSTCLPPPPPTPPPQFFPTYDERKCTRKRELKCKKIKADDSAGKDLKGKSQDKKDSKEKRMKDNREEGNRMKDNREEGNRKEDKEDEGKREENKKEEGNIQEDKKEEDKDKEVKKEDDKEEEVKREESKREKGHRKKDTGEEEFTESDVRSWTHIKRKCKKFVRPPCRKKSSEISNMFQPRQIPIQQKDLPETSPWKMPEVERQMQLSGRNSCQTNCKKNNCKMICNKKVRKQKAK